MACALSSVCVCVHVEMSYHDTWLLSGTDLHFGNPSNVVGSRLFVCACVRYAPLCASLAMSDPHLPTAAAANGTPSRVVYRVVLTGGVCVCVCSYGTLHVCVCVYAGPCAGKTTTLARLRTFFENLGWKVRTYLPRNCTCCKQ